MIDWLWASPISHTRSGIKPEPLPPDRDGVVEQGQANGPARAFVEISENCRCEGREPGLAEADGGAEDQEQPVVLEPDRYL